MLLFEYICRDRIAPAALIAVTLLACGCGRSSPAAPTPGSTTAPPAPSSLRIVGVPSAVSPGTVVPLKAEIVLGNEAPKECAANWSASDGRIATVSASGLLTAGVTGFVDVTASCAGLAATVKTRVEAVSPYRILIAPMDSQVPAGVVTRVEFLDGPLAGQVRVPNPGAFSHTFEHLLWPVTVRLTGDDYEPLTVVLAESTGTRRNPDSPLFDFRVPMTFIPPPGTDVHVRRMSWDESEIIHPFTVAHPGTVRVRTWWSVDYNDRLFIELWCGGAMIATAGQQAGAAGSGLTHDAAPAGACEVRLRQSKRDASTHYRVAITYPK